MRLFVNRRVSDRFDGRRRECGVVARWRFVAKKSSSIQSALKLFPVAYVS